MTGRPESAGTRSHQFDPVRSGQDEIEQHEAGPLGTDDAGDLAGLARRDRRVARVGEDVAHVAERVRTLWSRPHGFGGLVSA